MSDTDLDDIRRLDGGLLLVFRELCRTHRTTAVAARLGLSQSAVSQALSRLRDIYGDPLFQRRPHGLEPTPRALEIAPRIDALLEMMGASLRQGSDFDPSRTTRRFNVGLTEYAAGVVDGDLIALMQRQAPEASVGVEFIRGYIALSALRRGLLDLALGRFDTAPGGLTRAPLFEDRYCVVARRGHPHIQGRLSMKTWAGAGHIFASAKGSLDDDVMGPSVGEDAMPSRQAVKTVGVVPRWETAYAMVGQCDAIATGSRRLALKMAQAHGLQVIDLPDIAGWTCSMVRREERDEGLDWLCAQLETLSSTPDSPCNGP